MRHRRLVTALLIVPALLPLLAPRDAIACGGGPVYIADHPEARGTLVFHARHGVPLYQDAEGVVMVPTAAVKIANGLAAALLQTYLARNYPAARPPRLQGLVYEHGVLAYRFEVEVPGAAVTYHIGTIQHATDRWPLHVDAVTGAVYDLGCGGGPGEVAMVADPNAYPPEVRQRWLDFGHYATDWLIPEGQAPTIDGRIEAPEWADALHRRIRIGTEQEEVLDYG
jgi:hypothetical protein